MTDFYTKLDEYLGSGFDNTDIRAVVRRCWYYDFLDYPVRVWQGQGKLFTEDGNEWLGTIDASGRDIHKTPSIGDGRDGSSANYNFKLFIPSYPGKTDLETYTALKSEQSRVSKRTLTCYLALFEVGEGLRPQTPIVFFKEFTMMNATFSEKINLNSANQMIKNYEITILAKDGNFGRSEVPAGTYADATQKERARQLGVDLDRGCEFLAGMANRTYQPP